MTPLEKAAARVIHTGSAAAHREFRREQESYAKHLRAQELENVYCRTCGRNGGDCWADCDSREMEEMCR